ncbi:unnamed protein product [Mytilus coruscus]|uniref:Uncharacterized protein n=1 Tax=Mytilus coruscus TaxID=42192 RepID=A0A6J8D0T0_MYTCO|nr:unnamed protein product [Mytilus coruscus]
MDKPVIFMEATLDQLQSIEGIDNEMATQILEARDSSHFIDFNVVFGITGAEEQYGSQPKLLSTPASSTSYQDFSKKSPISKPTGLSKSNELYLMNKDIQGNLCASAETTLKFDTAPRVAKQKHEKPNTEVSVGRGPFAPPMDTPYIGQAQSKLKYSRMQHLSNKNRWIECLQLDRGLWLHQYPHMAKLII